MKNLVIVESPTKARTISRILGKEYAVTASMGHVRDLPENSLGVNISNGFQPFYQVTKRSVVANLKKFCADAKTVYLAPDPDREGEAIAWHIKEMLKGDVKCDFRRVVFHEITKSAVQNAFRNPGDINMNLVNSQQARRILDRIVGFKISEMLWSKISKGLSAGRVQSVALRIICEREREIQNFVPQEYWILNANFAKTDLSFSYKGKLSAIDGEKAGDIKAEQASAIALAVEAGRRNVISDLSVKKKFKYAPPPFITSTLQQAAVQYLRMTASQAMKVAQQLYEGVDIGEEGPVGLITYMRTDSFSVSNEALGACRDYILKNLGQEFLPSKPNFFKSSKSAQEAHEAIRPTIVYRTPESLKEYLGSDQYKLYSLIWKRFVASQSKAAEYDVATVLTTVEGSDGHNYEFRTQASTLVFPGYLKVYEIKTENEEDGDEVSDSDAAALIRALKQGEDVVLKNLDKEQKFTEPPPRFSEATLIKELESNGIGRPSTYATILGTILGRKYVEKTKGRLIPTELGFKVNDTLLRTMSELFQVGFTAEMEAELDKIEEGSLEWQKMLSDFYSQFCVWLKNAKLEGAPERGDARLLISALAGVKKWNESEKGGRKKYDDRKFFESVQEQYKSKGAISEKQWNALVSLAARYKDQIKDFDLLAGKLRIENIVAQRDMEDKERKDPQNVEKIAKIANLVSELAKIAKEQKAVQKEGDIKSRYDDTKFLYSFAKRLSSGYQLSEKQISVLRRIALKYKDKLLSFNELKDLINIDENAEKVSVSDKKMTGEKENEQVARIISELDKVKDWKQGGGRRGDKMFYVSLSKQFRAKGALSEKQFFALKKLASKYLENAASSEGAE